MFLKQKYNALKLFSSYTFQVVESTMLILKEFGYTFERRGLVKVKGKGELMTYFLVGKEDLQSMD